MLLEISACEDLLAELTILTITFTVWKKLSAGRSVYENNVLRPVTSSSWEFTTYPANSLGKGYRYVIRRRTKQIATEKLFLSKCHRFMRWLRADQM